MTIEHKVFADQEVLTADDVNNYLMDQTVVQVSTASDLGSLPSAVKTAWTADTGSLCHRDASGSWVIPPVLKTGIGVANFTTGANTDSVSVSFGQTYAAAPAVFITGTTSADEFQYDFWVSAVSTTGFTCLVRWSSTGGAPTSGAVNFNWLAIGN